MIAPVDPPPLCPEPLYPEPLTRDRFRPFGDVLERRGAEPRLINEGTTQRFHALGGVTLLDAQSRAIISIFSAVRRTFPLTVTMLERHPLGSQSFFPLEPFDWLIVVAEDRQSPIDLRCFRARGDQGVTYGAGVWHHPLLVLRPRHDFLVVDRDGPGRNCDEIQTF
jgi:ureidoglycolate lyase